MNIFIQRLLGRESCVVFFYFSTGTFSRTFRSRSARRSLLFAKNREHITKVKSRLCIFSVKSHCLEKMDGGKMDKYH